MPDKRKFEELTRDVDWQRAGFLRYCLRIAESTASEDIVKKILGGYLTLALLFYKQFRDDLKTHYENPLSDMSELEVKLVIQKALDKLVDEWSHVYAIIVAIHASGSGESQKIVARMAPFVDIAMKDVALKDFPVFLQFGQSYSLRFSNYSDSFAALSIPLCVLESPWEWTILWHELAGEKVRQLKLQNPGFFISQFSEIVESLQGEQSAILDAGWSTDWLEELFEDSFSVVHFPIHFLVVFKNLLERFPSGGAGQRHPSGSVRLAVAICLHLQMKNVYPDSVEPPVANDWPVWNKWKELDDEDEDSKQKFKESFDPYQLLRNSPLDIKVVWLTARKIREWHHSNNLDNNEPNGFREVIGKAIKRYSKFDFGKDNRDNIIQEVKDTIAALPVPTIAPQKLDDGKYSLFCDAVNGKLSDLSKTNIGIMLNAHPQVEKLLRILNPLPKPMSYLELLALSFYNMDFNVEIPRNIDFIYGAVRYHTNSINLGIALSTAFGFITTSGSPSDMVRIENKNCYITKANLDAIKSKGWIWV